MINRSARLLAIFLLLLNGIGALIGGWSLMSDPTGVELGLPPSWINRLPFTNYLIPGILLFVINGLLGILCAVGTFARAAGYERFIVTQGVLLMGWILVQVLMLQTVETLHISMLGIGLTLIALGMILSLNQARNGFDNNVNSHI
jgi:hypothetical protein